MQEQVKVTKNTVCEFALFHFVLFSGTEFIPGQQIRFSNDKGGLIMTGSEAAENSQMLPNIMAKRHLLYYNLYEKFQTELQIYEKSAK